MRHRLGASERDDGFTLIELLIVIIILGILSGIVVFAVGTTGANAASAACSADAKSFETALEEYKAQVGSYPGAVALQMAGATQSEPNYGQSWPLPSNQPAQLANTYGLLGNTSAPGGTWTAPNGVVVGPLLRALPSTAHYQILTDGNGGVFVYPPESVLGGPVDPQAVAMDNATVSGVLGTNPPVNAPDPSLNFEQDPGICSNTSVVS